MHKTEAVILVYSKVKTYWRKCISKIRHVYSMYLCPRVYVHVRLLEKKRVWGVSRVVEVGGYILVMLTEFYKLWLTPVPTAD